MNENLLIPDLIGPSSDYNDKYKNLKEYILDNNKEVSSQF
jgi:hypothetical protein